ncbi:hypothetical protein JYT20_01780 [Rhodothermus sp. AH-315-K08]|nr:hypothetical protein [Rhodothermus sp. AH-315-K08]
MRDLLFKRKQSFSELTDSEERISTNILTDRLHNLCKQSILSKTRLRENGPARINREGLRSCPHDGRNDPLVRSL